MSFNINGIGESICIISGGKYDKKIICVNSNKNEDKESDEELFKEFKHLKISNGTLIPYPNKNRERDILYFIGPSGSGKSYLMKDYIKNYRKVHPNNNIYVFSKVKNDKSLKDVEKYLKYFNMDTMNEALDMDDFENNILIIMDDTDTIRDKNILENVNKLRDQILECGRHKNISLCITSHIGAKGHSTKTILNETHQIIIYPKSGSNYKYLLKEYLNLDNKQLQKIKNMDTRYIIFVRQYPMILYSENEIYFLKDFN